MRPIGLRRASLVALGCCVWPSGATAEQFHYIDRDGRVHVVDRSSTAPVEFSRELAIAGKGLEYGEIIYEAAALYALPVALLVAVIEVESKFDPNAVSRVGAMGLMQLMPKTAAEVGVQNPFEPRQNVLGGARYLRILLNAFDGDVPVALGAYHAGSGAMRRNGRVAPTEQTRRYVEAVISRYRRYAAEFERMVQTNPQR